MSNLFSPGTFHLTAQQAGNDWNLVSGKVDNEEQMQMLCEALTDALPRLGFEPPAKIDLSGADKLTLPVTPPQRRHWAGTTLEAEAVLGAAATFEVRLNSRATSVRWKQGDIDTSAIVGQGGPNVIVRDGIVARASANPNVTLGDVHAVWKQTTGELEIDAGATFDDLPPFEQPFAADVVFVLTGESFDGAYDPATKRFKTTIMLREQHPRTLDLQVLWQAQWQSNPLQSQFTVTVPFHFGPAEFKSASRDFAAHIYLGMEPVCVRFAQHDYLPDELVLDFSFRDQSSRCLITHHEDTREPALYDVVEWIEEALADFRRAAPGRIQFSIADESGPRRQVMLLPGIIDGTWTFADRKPAFRLASSTLDETLIEKACDAVTAEPFEVNVTRRIVTMNEPMNLVTHFVFTDRSRVPINPGKFSPLFLRDPLCLWKQTNQRPRAAFAGALTEPLTDVTRYRGSDATEMQDPLTNGTIATTIVQDAAPGPTVFDFGGRHQLLICRHDAPPKGFGAAIRGDVVPSNKPLGLYFRGFYFTVEVVDVKGDYAPGSKLLLLQKPLPLQFGALTNHVMAFSPLRASYSHEHSMVSIIDRDQRVIALSLDGNGVFGDDSGEFFGRLGYVYGDRKTAQWTPAAGGDEPWLYTFDNLAFALKDEHLSFAGWLLPGSSAMFDEQPPFAPYAFDFTGQPASAKAVLEPFPLSVKNWLVPLPGVSDDVRKKFEKDVNDKLRELDITGNAQQQIGRAKFTVKVDDKREYQAVCESNPGMEEIHLLVGPPLRTPAVQFFTLP